jgi:c-di-GMP-binding flagellar brake protein YcgR
MMEERRRFPRRAVEGAFASIPATQQVQVLDISSGGVLLRAQRPLPLCARGTLHLSLGGVAFAAGVEIRRVTGEAETGAHRVGAIFLAISAEQRQAIERLVAT